MWIYRMTYFSSSRVIYHHDKVNCRSRCRVLLNKFRIFLITFEGAANCARLINLLRPDEPHNSPEHVKFSLEFPRSLHYWVINGSLNACSETRYLMLQHYIPSSPHLCGCSVIWFYFHSTPHDRRWWENLDRSSKIFLWIAESFQWFFCYTFRELSGLNSRWCFMIGSRKWT